VCCWVGWEQEYFGHKLEWYGDGWVGVEGGSGEWMSRSFDTLRGPRQGPRCPTMWHAGHVWVVSRSRRTVRGWGTPSHTHRHRGCIEACAGIRHHASLSICQFLQCKVLFAPTTKRSSLPPPKALISGEVGWPSMIKLDSSTVWSLALPNTQHRPPRRFKGERSGTQRGVDEFLKMMSCVGNH
jgi:hypothetical protein